MSDYIYMLESHLSPDQNRVVEEVQAAAGQAECQPVPDRRRHARHAGRLPHPRPGFRGGRQRAEGGQSHLRTEPAPQIVSTDENRKSAELVFPSGVTAQIAMSRQEKYARAGAKPQVSPATIQEDLRGRDFTCNAIALSLNKASRGLLLDPMNGLADIERKELRAVSTYGFYDDPSRLLRLVRFRVRLGFTVEERTADAGGQRARSRSGKARFRRAPWARNSSASAPKTARPRFSRRWKRRACWRCSRPRWPSPS